MSPIRNKATHLQVETNKRTYPTDDETDEGFVSPSVQRISHAKNRKDSEGNECNSSSSSSSSSNSSSDTDSQTDSSSSSSTSGGGSQHLHSSSDDEFETNAKNKEKETAKLSAKAEASSNSAKNTTTENKVTKDAAEKAESLALFVVNALLAKDNGDTGKDKVERTLMRCVRMMMQKHEILFKGMMRRLQITRETGYISFVTVANTLFEEDKLVITWSRIVALYAFGGQLALYCKENKMEDFTNTVALFMGKYAREVLAPYVCTHLGGWEKICDEFPDENEMENKIRRVLSWTAVGLGVAATVSYLTTR
ncbi:negative regulation of cellular pH reduction [Halocaridina rubra]|uniref:Negative regulation of cellular pH reduction n=1 Tax=Halocaridina rubra TaxID=373956 RepID=A0AAN8WLL1_HALRR